jgi:hypothetical protein
METTFGVSWEWAPLLKELGLAQNLKEFWVSFFAKKYERL